MVAPWKRLWHGTTTAIVGSPCPPYTAPRPLPVDNTLPPFFRRETGRPRRAWTPPRPRFVGARTVAAVARARYR